MAKRWVRRPEGSNWGEFGEDDQLGRLNYLTPEKVREGVAEVKEGVSFCLSLPLDVPGGTELVGGRRPPVLGVAEIGLEPGPSFNQPLGKNGRNVICDDLVTLFLQYSTQWDALSHVGAVFDADGDGIPEIVYYNGFRAGTDVVGERDGVVVGALKLGIETFAEKAIQGRGVMIDLAAHFPNQAHRVTFAELESIMRADGIAVEKGDIVCTHTGYGDALLAMNKKPDIPALQNHPSLSGHDPKILEWITDSGLAAIVADNMGVETPGADLPENADLHVHTMVPLHEHCIFKLGVPLGELWQLGPLARWLRARQRSRFLLTAPPLRLPGAVGSPLTPVATV